MTTVLTTSTTIPAGTSSIITVTLKSGYWYCYNQARRYEVTPNEVVVYYGSGSVERHPRANVAEITTL
ncbi:MAG: hypothetical protein ABI162_06860 [Luteolibacter sp.]